MSRATKRRATRSWEKARHAERILEEQRLRFSVRRERDQLDAECGRLRAVVRELERRLNIPESESRATIKPYRRDDE